jgi:hypothetical protein
MLMKIVIATHLVLTAVSPIVAQTEPKQLADLPITVPPQTAQQFGSLVQPVPPNPPPLPLPAVQPCVNIPQSPGAKQSLQSKLKSTLCRGSVHVVKVKLASHHSVEGRLMAVEPETFSLQTAFSSKPIKIRYDQVVGEPRIRIGANVIIGRTIGGVGVVLAIPAIPFILLGFAISGDISD